MLGTGEQTMEEKIWNEAIDAFAERLIRFYQHQTASSIPAVVEYHIKQVAKDLKKGEHNDRK